MTTIRGEWKGGSASTMSYIQNIRRYVGHQPIVAIGATVIVMDEDGAVLLQLPVRLRHLGLARWSAGTRGDAGGDSAA